MIKRNQTSLKVLSALIDFLLVIVSYLFSSWFRLRVLTMDIVNIALTPRMVFFAAVYAAGMLTVLALMGFYVSVRTRDLAWQLSILILGTTASVLVASTLLFIFRLEDFSRGVMIIFYFLTLILLGGKQAATRLVVKQMRAQGYNIKHEVVIGTGALAKQYESDVAEEPELGIQVEMLIEPEDREAVEEALSRTDIDDVVLALDAEQYRFITELILACVKHGLKYMVIPFYNDIMPSHPVIESVGHTKLINMRANRLEHVGWAALKRAFDVVCSFFGLIVLSPMLLAVAVGVKLSSPGPILFRQMRVGFNRREFQMLKFRSMRVNDESATAWTTAYDSRRTRFGSFIRKTSLDEFPQLINVLRGDMSLVGPRPELPYFVEKFREEIPLYMVKHQVKPGITGWAQVNGYRGDTSIRKRIEMDLWYIDNWSPLLDIRILFKTFFGSMINAEEKEGPALDADVKIIVAAHKPYWMPADPMYIPLQVGAEGKEPIGSVGMPEEKKDAASGERTKAKKQKNISCIDRIDSEELQGSDRKKVNAKPDVSSVKADEHPGVSGKKAKAHPDASRERTKAHPENHRKIFLRDNTGDNISSKNANYCELTGLYWAWKNLKADYIGIAQYRRHFSMKRHAKDRRDILTADQAKALLAGADVLLPTPRNYWIETNYSQYIHAHHKEDLDTTRQILAERYPDYIPVYDRIMKKTTGHRFNMFIMKREIFDAYCEWLFDVLFELENRLDISDYNENDRRVFGFVSERLLDIWLETNHVPSKDIPYIFMEKINWVTKGAAFLSRKFKKSH